MSETFSEIVRVAELAVAGSEADKSTLARLLDGIDLVSAGRPEERAYLAVLLDWLGMREQAMLALRPSGDNHDDQGAAEANLAGMLASGHGDYERARELLVRALAAAGDGTSLRAKILANLAALSLLHGEVGSASAWLAQAGDASGQVIDPAIDVLLVSTEFGIARARNDLPGLREAVSRLNEATRARIAELGSHHPLSVTAVASLAAAEFELAAIEESAENQERAITVLEVAAHRLAADLGADHPQALACLENLCVADLRLALASGRLDRATRAASALESVSLRIAVALGQGHPQARNAAANAVSARLDLDQRDWQALGSSVDPEDEQSHRVSVSAVSGPVEGEDRSALSDEPGRLTGNSTLIGQEHALGELLQRLRVREGLSQKELAAAARVDARTIRDLERSVTRYPRAETAHGIADALTLTGAERENWLLLASPPVGGAVTQGPDVAIKEREYGLLRPAGIAVDGLAATGPGLDEEAPPFDVETGAARLRETPFARGILASGAHEGTAEQAGQGENVPSGRSEDSEAAYKLTLAAFAAELRSLHIAQGRPSFSELASRAARAGYALSLAGLSEVFTGKRFPTRDYTIRLIRVLTDEPQAVPHWRQRWEHVDRLRQAAKSRVLEPVLAGDTSTDELEELRARNQWLSDAVKSLELRAQVAEARAEAADSLAIRLQEALYRHWPVNGVALARPGAKGAGPVLSIAFHPGGRMLAAGYGDGTLIVWDADSAQVRGWSNVNGGARPVHSVAFSPAGDILAVGSADGKVRLALAGASQFSGDPLTFIADSPVDEGPPIRSVAFGPGNLLAAGDAKGTVRVWQCRLDGESRVFSEPFYERQFGTDVRSLALMPDRQLLAAGTDKRRDSASTASLLDFGSGHGERPNMKFSGSVQSVAFSRHGDLVAIAEDHTVHLKSLNARGLSGTEPPASIRCGKGIRSLAFNPQADHLAVATGTTCVLYRVRPGQLRRERVIKVGAAACSLAFRPDGKLLAIGRADGVVQLYGPGAGWI